ncbi:MAG: hypothetical protein H7249_12760 [Chitinophagaceae bacterium]|nr:hypothetical protein [Oligoflexus sp.]
MSPSIFSFSVCSRNRSASDDIYVTDYENNAIRKLSIDNTWSLVAKGDQLIWPDSLALSHDGSLYVTSTQINRGKNIRGTDERIKPFKIYKIKGESGPLLLGAGKAAKAAKAP